ncbi:hypothetical protein E3E11_00075 [Oecophyllibacter saccharovorans]|uniref:DAGKc domain-containing protein n=1 Tax=Oecophyllibacter saccharovorans TaxID=2558360 RepID=A0A506USS3_9PROT|nr:acylglycerol kinase family protein [Oecophyllibacter saccharovorans]QDH14527.1 hypothetical protein E3E11_00075 [Oecophyllibacter saccharovorans]TPW36143.1 hypothetical protein E3202_01485 [Oecophyllibacter saccharovorans]
MRIALIHNPTSRRNRHDGNEFYQAGRERLGNLCISVHHEGKLLDHVRQLHEAGVELIVLNGGDGTVSAALSAIEQVYPLDRLPAIAVLPSGNTNLIASDVGFGLRGPEALDRLFSERPFRSSMRAPIRLTWPGAPERRPVLGMFGGCTGYARAVRIAHSPTVLKFAPHNLAVVLTLVSSIASLVLRRSRQKWLQGNPLRWQQKGAEVAEKTLQGNGQSFIFLVTALEKLSNGIWPFWESGTNRHGFHFLNVSAFPKRLSGALLHLLRGRVPDWLRNHPDYVSDLVNKGMMLETDSEFVLDGEVFPAAADGRLMLERGPLFRFLQA